MLGARDENLKESETAGEENCAVALLPEVLAIDQTRMNGVDMDHMDMDHMGGMGGMMAVWMGFWALLALAAFVTLVVLVVWIARRAFAVLERRGSAEEQLRARYATGEIDREEYLRRLHDLQAHDSGAGSQTTVDQRRS